MTVAQAVVPSELLAAVNAARRRCFVHDDFAKTGTLRFQFSPEPFRHFFNRWILQSFDIVEIRVIQNFQKRFHRFADLRVVINPADFWIHVAFY